MRYLYLFKSRVQTGKARVCVCTRFGFRGYDCSLVWGNVLVCFCCCRLLVTTLFFMAGYHVASFEQAYWGYANVPVVTFIRACYFDDVVYEQPRVGRLTPAHGSRPDNGYGK